MRLHTKNENLHSTLTEGVGTKDCLVHNPVDRVSIIFKIAKNGWE